MFGLLRCQMLSVFDRDPCLRYKWHYWALWVPWLGQMYLSVWRAKRYKLIWNKLDKGKNCISLLQVMLFFLSVHWKVVRIFFFGKDLGHLVPIDKGSFWYGQKWLIKFVTFWAKGITHMFIRVLGSYSLPLLSVPDPFIGINTHGLNDIKGYREWLYIVPFQQRQVFS